MDRDDCSPAPDLSSRQVEGLSAWSSYIRTLHAYRRLMSRAMAENEIPPAQMFALKEIGNADGITQRDLAEKLRVSRPTSTVMLQKMEKAGLVERLADETDQRFTHLHLTPEGAALHERMHGVIGEIVSQVMGSFSEKDCAELVRLLGLMHDNINAALDATPSDKQDADR